MLLWYGPCGTLPRGAQPRYLLMLDAGRLRVPNCYGCGGHRKVHRDTNRLRRRLIPTSSPKVAVEERL